MAERIEVGSLLMADGTVVPGPHVFTANPYLSGWSSMTGTTALQLDRAIESAGWTLFFMAGALQASALGSNAQGRMEKAMGRLIAAVKLEKCNCLEISAIESRSFLGVHRTTLSAHARHIQKSRSFHNLADLPDRTRSRLREWL